MNLANVAEEIQHRIIHIFGRDREGKRALNGGNDKLDRDPHFRDYVWFYEVRSDVGMRREFLTDIQIRLQYFHADDGRGLGASHQTGWCATIQCKLRPMLMFQLDRSGLVAYHILQSGAHCRLPKTPKSEHTFAVDAANHLLTGISL